MIKLRPDTAFMDISEYVTDSLNLAFTYTDLAGVVVELSTHTAEFEVRDDVGGNVLLTLTNGNGITLGDSTNNIQIEITKTQIGALGVGRYVYYYRDTDTAGRTNTLLTGTLEIME